MSVVCEEVKDQMTSLWASFKNEKIWEKGINLTVTKEKVITTINSLTVNYENYTIYPKASIKRPCPNKRLSLLNAYP